MGFAGHFWSIAGTLVRGEPAWRPWSTTVHDPVVGEVELTGRYSPVEGARSILLTLHGLGGTVETAYNCRAARAAVGAGVSCLRLAMRGADGRGGDFYHAGLTSDLLAAMESPEVAAHEKVYLLGYSLGGHVSLRLAAENPGGALRAVAAVCPPLDLDAGTRAFDSEVAWLYRRHVLGSLKAAYRSVAQRGPVPTPVERVMRVRGLREWDSLTVVPRHGFESVEHYYATQSAGPVLARVGAPTLIVSADDDPVVPAATVRPSLADLSPAVTSRWTGGGGHVGLPWRLDLGQDAPKGIEPQALAWLLQH